MALVVYCGVCGARFSTSESNAGKVGKCGSCKTRLPIQRSSLDRPQIRLFCPQCHDKLRAWPEQGGQQMHCNKCHHEIRLPLLEEELEEVIDSRQGPGPAPADFGAFSPGAESVDPALAEQTTTLSALYGEDEQAAATAKAAKAEAWRLKGVELVEQGRHAEALKCYDHAVVLAHEDVQIWHDKGACLADMGRHDEALECFDQALRIHPAYAMALVSKGLSLSALGRHQEAVESYDKALAINPDYALALYNKGVAVWQLGNEEEGKQLLRKAGSLDGMIAEQLKQQGLM
ncbi:MAG: tetratricopeptide repeat protein [Planctomycetota bacterium]